VKTEVARTESWLPLWLERDWILGLVLVLTVLLAYEPVWWAGYVWDDDVNITTNRCIVGPLGLKEIWTTQAAQFYPLTLTTFWMVHAICGKAPLPYHLVNVLMQAACSLVLWRVLRRLRIPGAWLGAALWALHPVQVESAAWISELKNTQSGLFFLLSILFFVRWHGAQSRGERTDTGWSYGLVLLFAALAMVSKSSTVVLPAILCLAAWWMDGPWRWRNLLTTTPVLVMSALATILSIGTAGAVDSTDPLTARSWPERFVDAGDAIWFYLGKLVWPHPLNAIYPHGQADAGHWISYLPLGAAIVLMAVLWIKCDSWLRPAFFAFAYFMIALFPALGLVSQSFIHHSVVADHLQYLADMGPLALVGAGLSQLPLFVAAERRWLTLVFNVALLLVLGMVSWQRAWVYESQLALWTDTVAKDPNGWLGFDNLGLALSQNGRMDEAMEKFGQSLAINPNNADAHSNLGSAYLSKGEIDPAMAEFQEAIKVGPTYPYAHNNLGSVYMRKGQVDEAILEFQEAVKDKPDYTKAMTNLGIAFLHEKRVDEAIVELRKVVEIVPENADAHMNLGGVLLQAGRLDEALVQLQEAVRLNPQNANAQSQLAQAETLEQQRAAPGK
jgi:tetratricopeptide (TPR) repeat protein